MRCAQVMNHSNQIQQPCNVYPQTIGDDLDFTRFCGIIYHDGPSERNLGPGLIGHLDDPALFIVCRMYRLTHYLNNLSR